jgi:carboxynorspermidine decarboxylase
MTPKMQRTGKSIQEFIKKHGASLKTPCYLIDESRLLRNLEKIAHLRERTRVRSVLALKCFSTWAVFDLIGEYLDGTTSSSLYEARLGYEKFGKEVHAYSVAFSDEEITAVLPFASKIIFNSVSQLKRFYSQVHGIPLGLRINPGVSYSAFDLADPARKYSRLGATDRKEVEEVTSLVSGFMFHCNCENGSFDTFNAIMDDIERNFGSLLHKVEWVSLGGGIRFTDENYPFDVFCERLSEFVNHFGVQVYLEPGDAVVTHSGYLVTKVLDIVHNGMDVAIVDAGVETHMLDVLVYRMEAKLGISSNDGHTYMVAGRTCLAADIFGTYTFSEKLKVGSLIPFEDAASYTMVKKNWFNGISMPSIAIWKRDGGLKIVKEFHYEDFIASLS